MAVRGVSAVRRGGGGCLASAVLESCFSATSRFPVPLIPSSFPRCVIPLPFYCILVLSYMLLQVKPCRPVVL